MNFGIVSTQQIAHKIELAVPIFHKSGEVTLLWEEEHAHLPDVALDIIFARPGGWVGMGLLFEAKQRGIPVVNDPAALLLSMDRVATASILQGERLPVPKFFCGYPQSVPFLPFVAKNIFDVAGFKQTPVVVQNETMQKALPKLPIFAQAYLEAEWEYKVYGIGPQILMYRQRPILHVADKMETRERIDPHPELAKVTQMAMRLLGLEICSMDFLAHANGFALTDINFSPALETDPDGYRFLAQYLTAKATRKQAGQP